MSFLSASGSLESAFGEFANRELGAENPESVLHQREQIGDLMIRAQFQSFLQLRRNPKHLEPFEEIVRSGQLPLELEQFTHRKIAWRRVFQSRSYRKYTERPRKLTT